jgi:hypothetical protein
VFLGALAAQEIDSVELDKAKIQAERNFKKDERDKDGRKAMTEYEAEARAIRAKTERLKALRLAKEAEAPTGEVPARPTAKRAVRKDK